MLLFTYFRFFMSELVVMVVVIEKIDFSFIHLILIIFLISPSKAYNLGMRIIYHTENLHKVVNNIR